MKSEYNFVHRKGRKIQVIFSIQPGKEISTGTTDDLEAVKFAEQYLQEFDSRRYFKNIPTFKEYATGFYSEDKRGYRKQT
jgi:hypothetical protein